MSEEKQQEPQVNRKNLLYRFDSLIKKFIPNFNVRAIVYFSLIFVVAIYLQIWRIGSHTPPPGGTQETVIADSKYWDSKEYKEKIQKQTVESFTSEFERWLNEKDQEFSKRKFEDMVFINSGLTKLTNDAQQTLETIVPESFNYLENHARARYQYAKNNGFLASKPTLEKFGNIVCDLDDKTENATNIELYKWQYADVDKFYKFSNTKPDWKTKVGDRIYDVSDPDSQFSFLVFHYPKTNKIVVADSAILESNGIDSKNTLARIDGHSDPSPKLNFKYGYEGCKKINNTTPELDYGQLD